MYKLFIIGVSMQKENLNNFSYGGIIYKTKPAWIKFLAGIFVINYLIFYKSLVRLLHLICLYLLL